MRDEKDLDKDVARLSGGGDSPFGYLVDGLNGAGSLLIFAVMFMMCADVLARDLLNRPIAGVAEMVAVSIVAIVFLQLASTLRHGRMSRADIFIDAFIARHPGPGHTLNAVFNVIGAAMCTVVFYATQPKLVKAWANSEFFGVQGVFTMPTWPLMAIVLVGTAITAIQYLLHAWHDLRMAVSSHFAAGKT
jgi:TRAP-type mannitol/chloroaromatic compound transport system permease small subunit